MMVRVLVCAALCLAVQFSGAAAAPKSSSFPKDFIKCKRNDVPCLKIAIQKALEVMAKGMPKLGILPIDPLRVTEMFIDQGHGPVSLKLTLKDQDLYGISSSRVDRVESNMTDSHYRLLVEVTIPTFVLRGNYVVDGSVLILPLKGAGKDNLTLTDLTAKLLTIGHIVRRNDGKDYIVLDEFTFKFDTTRLYIQLENLFKGDKAVEDNMLVFLNENWRDILNEVQPGIEEALTAVFKQVSERMFAKVPYSIMVED